MSARAKDFFIFARGAQSSKHQNQSNRDPDSQGLKTLSIGLESYSPEQFKFHKLHPRDRDIIEPKQLQEH
jgi:hypothetical protein